MKFWREFAYQGEPQIRFLFDNDMLAILLDFFLEKNSPLVNFRDKKHTIGNRYAPAP